jgi:2,3-bisphosphoglycerate-dependent phosphoglycerate mutase
VKYLEGIPDEQIVDVNIPTGVPLVEELDDDLKSIRHYYLADPARIQEATLEAASTGKTR